MSNFWGAVHFDTTSFFIVDLLKIISKLFVNQNKKSYLCSRYYEIVA